MNSLVLRATVLASLILARSAPAQADRVFLRPEANGPMGVLTAVAFSPDGTRLYSAGFDKVVRVWTLEKDQFQLSRTSYRVPVGPGFSGVINAIAVSPDGHWLAVGGLGVITGRGDVRTVGMVFPSSGKSREQLEDEGSVFVFNTANERDIRVLRGHQGVIRALAFADSPADQRPLLVSAAEEPVAGAKPVGRVRLWDLAARSALAEQTIDTANTAAAPGISAWRTGAGPRDVRAAIAWGDGNLRVWSADAGTIKPANDGSYNSSASRAGAAGEFWTTSFDHASNSGALTRWQSGAVAPVAAGKIALPPDDPQRGPFTVPREIATFPTRPGGPIDRAAVIARRQGAAASPSDQDVLILVDLERRQIIGSPRKLGTFVTNLRRLAVSPSGRHVAVADADGQQVWVFATTDLAAHGDRAEPATLRGVGANFAKVGFRKKGDAPGLALESSNGDKLVFDFQGRQLLPDDATWLSDRPDTAGWSVRPIVEGGRLIAAVAGPGQAEQRLILAENGRAITAAALLPPRPPFAPSAVLIAAWLDDRSQPALAAFDVAPGTIVRQLSGHIAAVRSLSLSGDGRLLASAADDQTVCLWSMRSLDQVIGKVGAIPGLKLRTESGRTLVVEAPAASNIQAGAVVETLTVNGQSKSPTSAVDCFTTIWQSKPRSEATVRVRAGEAAARDVRLTVGQGADERKPLLSLFVTRDGPINRRDWIAWTSIGPYDSSSPRAEEHLGWHFNPDQPRDGEPVSFARADKYRDAYQKPGILAHVIRTANTLEALKEFEGKPPIMGVMLDGVDPAAPIVVDRPLARDRKISVRAALEPPFPLERVSEMRWRLDDGPWQALDGPDQRTWSADIAGLKWGRGPHRVQVELATDGKTRRYESQALFHYAPAPPRISFDPAWLTARGLTADGFLLRGETKNAVFPLEATIESGSPDDQPVLQIRLNGNSLPVDSANLKKTLTLREGDNVIELIATNAGATEDLKRLETDVRVIRIQYSRVTAPPRISLQVVSAPGRRDGRSTGPDGKLAVHDKVVHVVGTVTSEEADPVIERAGRRIPVIAGDKPNTFRFVESVALDRPGETVLTYSGQTRRSPKAGERVAVVYQPELPLIGAIEPGETDVLASDIVLKAELSPPNHEYPCSAEVIVNGDVQQTMKVPSTSRQLQAPVRLRPRANSVVIRLQNEWGESRTRQIEFRFRRPPVIEQLNAPPTAAESAATVTATVRSPAELPPTSATVNDRRFDHDQFTARSVGDDRWNLAISGVHLDEGDNTLNVTVANDDGESASPKSVRIRYDKPLPPKPEVGFTGLANGESANIRTLEHKLLINVRSTTDLRRVEVRTSDGHVAFLRAAGVTPLDNEPVVVKVPYGGRTTVTLTAANAGGESSATISLQRPQMAAYVLIDSLADSRSGEPLPASSRAADAPLIFESAKDGRLKITGRVFFDPADPRSQTAATVRVRANAFQQIPVETTPSTERPNECRFSATVLLTRAEDNEIIVDLPQLPKADGCGDTCIVRRCAKPSFGRRLHMVVVGVGARDGDNLQKTALRAIGAEEIAAAGTARTKWRALPIFEEVQPYAPLVGDVEKSQIIKRLQDVAKQIRIRSDSRDTALSDVVLLCYQGKEVINDRGHFLWTSDSRSTNVHIRGLSCMDIVREFERTGGAQVLLLDVERLDTSPRQVAQTFANTRLGVFHAAWTGPRSPSHGLLALLEQSWPKANRLGPLAEQLGALQQSLEPQLQFSPHIVGQLAQLEFGGLTESRR